MRKQRLITQNYRSKLLRKIIDSILYRAKVGEL